MQRTKLHLLCCDQRPHPVGNRNHHLLRFKSSQPNQPMCTRHLVFLRNFNRLTVDRNKNFIRASSCIQIQKLLVRHRNTKRSILQNKLLSRENFHDIRILFRTGRHIHALLFFRSLSMFRFNILCRQKLCPGTLIGKYAAAARLPQSFL